MANTTLLIVIEVILTLLTGGVFLIYPQIVRRGLLFGIYVGEKIFESEEAVQITRSWYVWMIAAIIISLALGVYTVLALRTPSGIILPVVFQLSAFALLYLRAHTRARALAPSEPPAAATEIQAPAPPGSTRLPLIAIAAGIVLGVLAMLYAWMHYADLPDRVPSHFGISGRPDAWEPKSFFTIMLLPLMSLFMGAGLGIIAWLTARAKRTPRLGDRGLSLEAQQRFRSAMTRFVSGLALLTATLLATMSVMAVQVGLGWRPGLPSALLGLTAALVAFALGGTLYIAFRYGQGGARLEQASPAAPLTNGLADNRNWVLGIFYVNREDPSLLIERRFGFGYTLNFGNWKAILLLAAFLAAVLGLPLAALLSR